MGQDEVEEVDHYAYGRKARVWSFESLWIPRDLWDSTAVSGE